MRPFLNICVFIGLFFSTTEVYCQIYSIEEQLRIEILKRGIDEAELQLALIEEGIDYNNLQGLGPAEIEKIRIVIRELELKSPDSLQPADGTGLFADTTGRKLDSLMIDSLETSEELLEEDSIEYTIYGHQLFRSGRINLITDEDGYLPPIDYILGRGDEISVGIYGRSRLNENYVIGADGAISIYPNANNPTGNERVFIGGLTLEAARDKLIGDFRKFYQFSPTQFTLGVNAVRKVRVQVNGEVNSPGEFNVSGLNSVANVIAAAGGFTDIGGVRLIKVNKRDGRTLTFDLYKLLTSPAYVSSFSLDNGDLIFVPAAQELVSVDGAIRRPFVYELIEGEGINELVSYAGGLDKGAFLSSFDLQRYENDKLIYRQIPYAQLLKSRSNYTLQNGDEVTIDRIEEKLENYVTVLGDVRNVGNFELVENMSLKDLILLAQPLPTARLDAAYIKRTNSDGNINTIPISIIDIINGAGTDVTIELQDKDEITIWPLDRFTDDKEVKIGGAVREPIAVSYDNQGTMRISDLVVMAGGLGRDAAAYAHVHRIDPLNPQELKYVRIDLDRVMNDPKAIDNIYLEPFDSVHVYKRNEFLEDVTITVSGAVNNPGSFLYGEGMSLRDAIVMAGEFKLSAATNDIEVSRVIIRDNEPTRTVVEKVSISRDELRNFSVNSEQFQLEPFDNVFVRYVPQFELQQNVIILGEVTLPGEYSLERDNETVYDLIKRAGGLTTEAFPPGAILTRSENNLGLMVLRLEDVIRDPSSKYNYALKDMDSLFIPKIQDYVLIEGAAQYLVQNDLKQVVTPFHKGKDARFYIDEYAGGFAENAISNKIFVKYPNGEVKKTEKKFPFGRKHPQVAPGAIIQIGAKKPELNNGKDEENVNWTKVLGDSVAQAMSILTLLLLVERLD